MPAIKKGENSALNEHYESKGKGEPVRLGREERAYPQSAEEPSSRPPREKGRNTRSH